MKKYTSKILPALIIIAIIAYLPVISSTAQEAEQSKPAEKKEAVAASKLKYLENVLFEKLPGKERVNLVVSEQPVIKAEGQTNGSLLVKLEDTSAPENLRQGLGEGQLNNILRVTPSERQVNGKQWVYLMIDIKSVVPYSINQEGKNVTIDFNVASLPEKKTPPAVPIAAEKTPQVKPKKVAAAKAETATEKIQPIKKEVAETYTGKYISIDFQDADIKSVLRLMAEYGNVSIVAGDDVKGNITLSMKNVAWEQALDTIMEVNGLSKKEIGNIITVITLDRKKKDESTRKTAEDDQFKADQTRRERDRTLLAEQGKLKQILIEAKIVEANEDFLRNLGVQWGFTKLGSVGTYGSRVSGGTSTRPSPNASQYTYPPEITMTDTIGNPLYMAAVNMASTLVGIPTLGVIFGKGSNFLEAQLAAMEKTTSGKIISSPKVVTMDDVKAVIKQGEEVPYIVETVSATGAVTRSVQFKDALLKLEVKPKITEEGKISMVIKATNDRADYTNVIMFNPPILKNEVESVVVINDGDTVVIGGISIDKNEKIDTGVPWFHKIPILGYLFKFEEITKEKKQLLIFVTPKILKGSSFAETNEKQIN